MNDETGKKRGFAALTPERRHEIAAMGGKSVPARKRTFSRKKALARTAGRKGGLAVPAAKRTFSWDRTAAAVAGAKGGRNVIAERRPFSRDRALACRAGRKGGRASTHRRVQPDPVTADDSSAKPN